MLKISSLRLGSLSRASFSGGSSILSSKFCTCGNKQTAINHGERRQILSGRYDFSGTDWQIGLSGRHNLQPRGRSILESLAGPL